MSLKDKVVYVLEAFTENLGELKFESYFPKEPRAVILVDDVDLAVRQLKDTKWSVSWGSYKCSICKKKSSIWVRMIKPTDKRVCIDCRIEEEFD